MFFAHRVWFNLKASLVNKESKFEAKKIISLLSKVEVTAQQGKEKLFLASSDNLIKLISKANLWNLFDPECQTIYKTQF